MNSRFSWFSRKMLLGPHGQMSFCLTNVRLGLITRSFRTMDNINPKSQMSYIFQWKINRNIKCFKVNITMIIYSFKLWGNCFYEYNRCIAYILKCYASIVFTFSSFAFWIKFIVKKFIDAIIINCIWVPFWWNMYFKIEISWSSDQLLHTLYAPLRKQLIKPIFQIQGQIA